MRRALDVLIPATLLALAFTLVVENLGFDTAVSIALFACALVLFVEGVRG